MSLFVMIVLGLIVGAVVFSFAVGVVLCGYLIVTGGKTGNNEQNIDRYDEIKPQKWETPPQSRDEQVLKEWDEHVRKNGGYSNEDWIKAMKDRDKR